MKLKVGLCLGIMLELAMLAKIGFLQAHGAFSKAPLTLSKELATMLLFGVGLVGLGGVMRWQIRKGR